MPGRTRKRMMHPSDGKSISRGRQSISHESSSGREEDGIEEESEKDAGDADGVKAVSGDQRPLPSVSRIFFSS